MALLIFTFGCSSNRKLENEFVIKKNSKVETCWEPICREFSLDISIWDNIEFKSRDYYYFESKDPFFSTSPARSDNLVYAYILIVEFSTIEEANSRMSYFSDNFRLDSSFVIDQTLILIDELDDKNVIVSDLAEWALLNVTEQ